MRRILIGHNPNLADFAAEVRGPQSPVPLRAVVADLDDVYSADPAEQERNLSALLDRIEIFRPTHVYLKATSDTNSDGIADAAYFPNRLLSMRADLFNRVAWQLGTRNDVKVFALLPTPGLGLSEEKTIGFYEDLARHAAFDGFLFDDTVSPEAAHRIAARVGAFRAPMKIARSLGASPQGIAVEHEPSYPGDDAQGRIFAEQRQRRRLARAADARASAGRTDRLRLRPRRRAARRPATREDRAGNVVARLSDDRPAGGRKMIPQGMGAFHVFLGFTFYYPLFMAYLWMTGALFYYYRFERAPKGLPRDQREPAPVLREYPPVSFVVPCHNEGTTIRDTVEYLLASTYPAFDIVLVNDGSKDETREILDALAARDERIRVIHLAENQGKAVALATAAVMTRAQFLCCIDADALLDPDALTWLMAHFASSPRVGAVTGNPRVRNRSTLLGRLQVGEFSSIVGMIKRAQRTYGRIFTVSGVVACFRKSALHEVGYWSPDMLTEDIDVSWKLQLRHWDVRFEPNALCWILTPETLSGLWQQRLRWAMGGIQVLMKNWRIEHFWKARRMWPVLVEYLTSVGWAYAMLAVALLWLHRQVFELPPDYRVESLFSGWNGVVLGTTCLMQIGVSLPLDSRYDKGSVQEFFLDDLVPAGVLDAQHDHNDSSGAARAAA